MADAATATGQGGDRPAEPTGSAQPPGAGPNVGTSAGPADPAAPPEPDPAPGSGDSTGSTAGAAAGGYPSEDEVDARDQRYGARVINQFFGQVQGAHATFGVSGGGMATPTLVGRLRPADIEHALRHYARPEGFGAARQRLTTSHLVVLTGAEGTGRRAAAFALLQQQTGAGTQITGLSPASTLAQLADYEFVQGRGYVVLDWLGERRDGAVQAFEVGRISERLERAGAFLVITTEARPTIRRDLPDFALLWHCPEPLDIVDACLGRPDAPGLTADEWARVRDRAAELSRPAEVVRLLDRLPQGVDAALAEVAQTARRRVEEWFTEASDWDELLTVAALAFAYELPERTFEEARTRLGEIERAELLRPVGVEPAAPPAPTALQGRRGLQREGGIFTRQEGTNLDGDLVGHERRIVFTDGEMREHVLRELYECDIRLWRPLRLWMHELAASHDLDISLQLALGLTLLARNRSAAQETGDLLEAWAGGRAPERFTAVSTVSFMAGDDVLAPAALRTVLGWTEDRGQNRAVTAAMALGGPLGVRYPTEAERWLWHLSTRGLRIRVVAVRSLGLLFCTTANDLDGATALLKRLQHRLRRTLADAGDLLRGRFAIEAVLEVLSVQHLDRDEPMVAYLLRERPATTAIVGALWAEVLRSLPHRGAAMDALRVALAALAHDAAAGDAVAALGDAVRDRLSPDECVLLQRDLAWALRIPLGAADRYRPVVKALLAALTVPPRPATAVPSRRPAHR